MSELTKAIGDVVRRVHNTPIGKPPLARRRSGGGMGDTSSFARKSTSGTTARFHTGVVKQSGCASYTMVDPEVVVGGGTREAPWYVQIRVEAGNPSSATLVCTAVDQDDSGNFLFKTIAEVYLNGGSAFFKKDRRPDFVMRSPI